MLLLFLSHLGYAQINTRNRKNYLSLKSLFPTSALEKEALFGIGIQKKYKQIGIEVEYGKIFLLWGFWDEVIYGGEVFEAKTRGNRIRLNLKYYLFEKSNNINTDFLGYLSLMPSFSKVKYNMSFIVEAGTQIMPQPEQVKTYTIKYTKVVKDLEGNDVEVIDDQRIEVVTKEQLESQKAQYQRMITEIDAKLSEIINCKKG